MNNLSYLVFLSSMMLVSMTFTSCKSSNKPAVEASRIGERIKAYMEK